MNPVPDRGPQVVKLMWSLTSLALVTVFLRVYVRVRNRKFGVDDVFMLLSMVLPPLASHGRFFFVSTR